METGENNVLDEKGEAIDELCQEVYEEISTIIMYQDYAYRLGRHLDVLLTNLCMAHVRSSENAEDKAMDDLFIKSISTRAEYFLNRIREKMKEDIE